MTDISQSRGRKPQMTLAVIAYNQEHLVRDAVLAAFAQTFEPLEIILSDDHSADGTLRVMQELAATYEGPHEVIVRSNGKNLGIAGHVNEIVSLARGKYLALAAGDDISHPARMAKTFEAFQANELSFVEGGYFAIDEDGDRTGDDYKAAPRSIDLKSFLLRRPTRVVGSARTYDIDALRTFPPLALNCPTEDATSLLRCLLVGGGKISEDIYVYRRFHDANVSGRQNIRAMLPKRMAHYKQHLKDIEHARKASLIDHETSAFARKMVRANFKRQLIKYLIVSEPVSFRMLALGISSRALNLREIAGYFKRMLSGKRTSIADS